MVEGNATLNHLNRLLRGVFSPFTGSANPGPFPYFVVLSNHDIEGYARSGGVAPQSQYQHYSTYVDLTLATRPAR